MIAGGNGNEGNPAPAGPTMKCRAWGGRHVNQTALFLQGAFQRTGKQTTSPVGIGVGFIEDGQVKSPVEPKGLMGRGQD